MSYYYLGIDPGASGGLALIDDGDYIAFAKMPDSEHGILEWLDRHLPQQSDSEHTKVHGIADFPTRCVIEQVGGTVGKQQPGSMMFNFGMSYGGLRMALAASGFREGHEYVAVHSRTWQKAFNVEKTPKSVPEDKRQAWHKRALRRVAERLFPQLVVTDSTADALLLAYYAKHHQVWG